VSVRERELMCEREREREHSNESERKKLIEVKFILWVDEVR